MPVEYFEIHESVGGKDNYEMMRGSKDRIKKWSNSAPSVREMFALNYFVLQLCPNQGQGSPSV